MKCGSSLYAYVYPLPLVLPFSYPFHHLYRYHRHCNHSYNYRYAYPFPHLHVYIYYPYHDINHYPPPTITFDTTSVTSTVTAATYKIGTFRFYDEDENKYEIGLFLVKILRKGLIRKVFTGTIKLTHF